MSENGEWQEWCSRNLPQDSWSDEDHYGTPNVHGEDWDILFVRGPRTARTLGLAENMGIGDAAILLRALNVPFRRDPRYIGFMPHWQSLSSDSWPVARMGALPLVVECGYRGLVAAAMARPQAEPGPHPSTTGFVRPTSAPTFKNGHLA